MLDADRLVVIFGRPRTIIAISMYGRIPRFVVNLASMMYILLNLISCGKLSIASNLYPIDLGPSSLL